MTQNFRAALRGLMKSRRFTALVLISLGLGIAVNSAMFAAIDSLLLRSLAASRPHELMLYKRAWSGGEQTRFAYPAYQFFRDESQTLDGIGGVTILNRVRARAAEGGAQGPKDVTAQMVTGGFFEVLGLTPFLGRMIAPTDDTVQGQHAVAVLSHAYWRRTFASDPTVIGRTLTLNEVPFTIIGVAPRDFSGVEPGTAPDVWVPTMMQGTIMDLPSLVNLPTFNWLYLIARPKSGIDRAQAVAEQTLLQQRYNEQRAQRAQTEQARRNLLREQLQVLPAGGGITRLADSYYRPMVTLMAAVGLVLLMSCLNLSTLALARMTQRMKEMAIRFAVGAKPSQVVWYLACESLLLSVVGTLIGIVLGQSLLTVTTQLIPAGPTRIPMTLNSELSYRTVAFSAGLATLVTILFTIVPAIRIMRTDLVKGLSDNAGRLVIGNTGRGGLVRNLIMTAQVAASIVLLMCGAMFLETLRNLKSQALGFDPNGVAAFQLAMPRTYQPAQVHQFSLRLLDRLMAVPGLDAVTWGSPSLLSGYESRMLVSTGDAAAASEAQVEAFGMAVAPNFFSAMRVGVVGGRVFGAEDSSGSPAVGVLSETTARALFRDKSPIGGYVRVRTAETPYGEPIAIVGVVRDIRYKDLRSGIAPLVYRPIAQQTLGLVDGIVVRSSLDSARLADTLRREMRIVDPNAVLDEMETIAQRVDRWTERERILASIAGVFAVLALLLACLGMYGVTSMVVSDRRREIAIRLAIGSSLKQVTWLFARRCLTVAIAGAVVGLPAALFFAGVLNTYFFNVKPWASAGLWLAVVPAVAIPTIASWLAARSEGRVEPASVLKTTSTA